MRPNPLAMLAGLAAGLVFVPATPAVADVVRLTNGRTMTVDRARFDGETVILLMRGGGEIRAPRSLIEELLPDEEPWARTAALRALANSPTAAGPRPDADTLRAMVDRVARRVGVSPRLAHALVQVESNYNLLAVSHRGAMGLTQIMPAVARTYAPSAASARKVSGRAPRAGRLQRRRDGGLALWRRAAVPRDAGVRAADHGVAALSDQFVSRGV
jgi:soluble lytic murein transglycosylase-like protein